MVKNKAPGPDGIPAELYQACWSIIKDDVMNIFYDWKQGVLNLYRLNFGMIMLLQKTPDADIIQKYRPICLLQVLYKWLTKVATLRVEPYMNKLISPCQTAFIKGRNIMDQCRLWFHITETTHMRDATTIYQPMISSYVVFLKYRLLTKKCKSLSDCYRPK
jgi:hypothetical protein